MHDLRKLIAQNGDLSLESLRLIWRGNVLHDNKNGDDALVQLSNGGLHLNFALFIVSTIFSFCSNKCVLV